MRVGWVECLGYVSRNVCVVTGCVSILKFVCFEWLTQDSDRLWNMDQGHQESMVLSQLLLASETYAGLLDSTCLFYPLSNVACRAWCLHW